MSRANQVVGNQEVW